MSKQRMSQSVRRLHLDFHNPAGIPDLCADFDAAEFAATIREAGFDSVTVFALDAHGHCYYPTCRGVPHPDLKIDFLGQAVAACRNEGLRVGAYIAAGMSDYTPVRWCQVDAAGQARTFPEQGGYQMVCLNSPHVERTILPVTEEVMRNYPVDCIFYDLLQFFDEGCHCRRCQSLMREWRLLWRSPADVRQLTRRTVGLFADKTAALIHGRNAAVEISYNTMSIHERPAGIEHAAYVDVEAPATGGWGYFYFPPRARYLRTLGLPVSGMTVAFHTSWGGFGGVKSKAQLEHECYTFIAGAAGVGVGDQLPPRGRLETARYERIGDVLQPIREMEPLLVNARPVVEAAIVLPPLGQGQFPSAQWAAATKVLLEAKVQFDTVDREGDWSCYRLLILPDQAHGDAAFRRKVNAYLRGGGKVLATGTAVDALPAGMVKRTSEAFSPPAYLRVGPEADDGIAALPHVVQAGFLTVRARGARLLATLTRAYEKRGPRFSFSAQLPYARDTQQGVVFAWEDLIYVSAPLFTEYWKTGYGAHRQILVNCLRRLLPKPLVTTNAPLSWEIALLGQGRKRLCVIVPYGPLRTGELGPQLDHCTAQIDDWAPTADLEIRVRGRVVRAVVAPGGAEVPTTPGRGHSRLSIPVVRGPMVVVMEGGKRHE